MSIIYLDHKRLKKVFAFTQGLKSFRANVPVLEKVLRWCLYVCRKFSDNVETGLFTVQ